MARRETALSKTGVFSVSAFKYDIGCFIEDFLPGQSATLIVEMSKDGADWLEVVEFLLDDNAEVIAPQVYVDAAVVRARLVTEQGKPAINIWIRETD